jgi:hypothetical protein
MRLPSDKGVNGGLNPLVRVLVGLAIIGSVVWQLSTGTVHMGRTIPDETLSQGWWILAIETVFGILVIIWGVVGLISSAPPDI